MKIQLTSIVLAVVLVAAINSVHAQSNPSDAKLVTGLTLDADGPLSPLVGETYRFIPFLIGENPFDGTSESFGAAVQPDPDTGMIHDPVLDAKATVTGTDYADVFGHPAANPVIIYECLESFGVDPFSGRFILRLTLAIETTATELQWDTLDMDLLDPADIDGDGNTDEPDGTFDTGDDIADQPFPLDPVGLTVQIDYDGDGDPSNDPPTHAVGPGLFVGKSAGGASVPFDPEAGPADILYMAWEFRGFNDNDGDGINDLADLDLDGTPDGTFDLTALDLDCGSPGSGWCGDLGVAFNPDGNPLTTQDVVSGSVKTINLVIDYRSDIEAEFCYDPKAIDLCGDINFDGSVDLLDVQPFVNIIISGVYDPVADINEDGFVNLEDVAPFVLKLGG